MDVKNYEACIFGYSIRKNTLINSLMLGDVTQPYEFINAGGSYITTDSRLALAGNTNFIELFNKEVLVLIESEILKGIDKVKTTYSSINNLADGITIYKKLNSTSNLGSITDYKDERVGKEVEAFNNNPIEYMIENLSARVNNFSHRCKKSESSYTLMETSYDDLLVYMYYNEKENKVFDKETSNYLKILLDASTALTNSMILLFGLGKDLREHEADMLLNSLELLENGCESRLWELLAKISYIYIISMSVLGHINKRNK